MPEMPRGADFLHLHHNVSRRVSNLETGVHPTGTELNFWDSYGPYQWTLREGWGHGFNAPVHWQRRAGLVMLTGAIAPQGGWAAKADPSHVTTLPPLARPTRDMTFVCVIDGAPFQTRVTVKANGQLWAHRPLGDLQYTGADCGLDVCQWAAE
jgi:hypothetical protein